MDAVLRLKGSGNLKAIQIIKIPGGILEESFLDEGFLLNKKVNLYFIKVLMLICIIFSILHNICAIKMYSNVPYLVICIVNILRFISMQVGVHQPKRIENANILIANTPMDTDKIKVFGSTIKVDSMAKIAELEVAEKEKMKDKVNKILAHKCNVFINR